MISEASAPFRLSMHRRVPLVQRRDLMVQPMDFQGVRYFVIKDPVALKYHRLPAEQYHALQQLDGERSLEEIRVELTRKFPTVRPTVAETQELISRLHQEGLAVSNRSGQGTARAEQHREKQGKSVLSACFNLLSIRLPGVDPDRFFQWVLPFTRWMFHPVTMIAAGLLILSSLLLVTMEADELRKRLPAASQFFGWKNLFALWVVMGVTKIFHEIGHGLSCRYYGAECHQIGVTLLAFFPTLYCDVTDSWMLPNKWHRILIGAAGMIVESVLASMAFLVWCFTNDGTVNAIALNVFFVSAVTTVIFNINPLMRLDGYYMLSDFWEIPNLRQLAAQAQQAWFAKVFLGAELVSAENSATAGKPWLVVFALASAAYGWSVMAGMLLMLHTAMKPYGLQSVGTTLATLAGTSFLIGTVMSAFRLTKMPRTQPLRPERVATSVVVSLLFVAAFFFLPIPWYRSATFMLEPRDVRHVHTAAAGDLVRVLVKPGDNVEAGQILAELADPVKHDRRRQLLVDRQVQKQEIALYEAIDDPATAAVAREALASIDREIAEIDADLKLLTLTAPCAGTIVAPARTPRQKMEQAKLHLENWTGTPLDEKNADCFLEERTHLLDIAPGPKQQALIYLDQADLGDVRPSMELHLKFDEHSDRTYTGFIRVISSAQFDEVPPNLSTKHGGQLATVTGNDGKERVQDALYKVEVDLESEFPGLQSGLRGEARFLVTNRTAARWVWRAFQRTFNFRL